METPDGKGGVVVILPDPLWVLLGVEAEVRVTASPLAVQSGTSEINIFISTSHPQWNPETQLLARPNGAHLVVFYQDVTGCIEDLGVQRICVLGQGVVVVEAIDLHVPQADLIVGVDGGGVEEAADLGRQQI